MQPGAPIVDQVLTYQDPQTAAVANFKERAANVSLALF